MKEIISNYNTWKRILNLSSKSQIGLLIFYFLHLSLEILATVTSASAITYVSIFNEQKSILYFFFTFAFILLSILSLMFFNNISNNIRQKSFYLLISDIDFSKLYKTNTNKNSIPNILSKDIDSIINFGIYISQVISSLFTTIIIILVVASYNVKISIVLLLIYILFSLYFKLKTKTFKQNNELLYNSSEDYNDFISNSLIDKNKRKTTAFSDSEYQTYQSKVINKYIDISSRYNKFLSKNNSLLLTIISTLIFVLTIFLVREVCFYKFNLTVFLIIFPYIKNVLNNSVFIHY